MNETLKNIFQSAKNECIEAMLSYLTENSYNNKVINKVIFSPAIRISSPKDSDEFFEDITDIEYNEKENTWYVHNYITDESLDVDEYYTPLRDMTFEELYEIAERL